MAVDKSPDVYSISDTDLDRIREFLVRVGGPNVNWGAANVLDVWMVEQRMKAEDLASRRLLVATWVLAAATIALVVATIGLVVVALAV